MALYLIDASDITFYCYFFTACILPLILLSFLFPWRDRPPLDWGFIWKQGALSLIALFYLLIRYGIFDYESTVRIAALLWVNLVLSELFVIYFIYNERFKGRIRHWLRKHILRKKEVQKTYDKGTFPPVR